MKIVNSGKTYMIYGDDLITYDSLPKGAYSVCFGQMTGFFLEKLEDVKVEEKIYGKQPAKVEKMLKAFSSTTRNLGVILSGKKGIGKSICAKLLTQRAIEEGYAVIFVDRYIPGIQTFINSIQQKVIVIFDEFEKTFKLLSDSDSNRPAPQDEMLTLFDGIMSSNKMFVIICNELVNLSNYLINRPGRFHYHLNFGYPTATEIREYLTDKLNSDVAETELPEVMRFASRVSLNFDCLRAIVEELNRGESFRDAISDLNIISTEREDYEVFIVYNTGKTSKACTRRCNIFREDTFEDYRNLTKDFSNEYPQLKSMCGNSIGFEYSFKFCDLQETENLGELVVPGHKIDTNWEYGSDNPELQKIFDEIDVEKIIMRKIPEKDLHYLV